MAKVNMNHAAFVNALRMHGGARFFDLGGQAAPTLAPQATTVAPLNNSGQNASTFVNSQASVINPVNGLSPSGMANAGQGLATTVGQIGTGVASDLTAQNGYQAQLAPTTQLNYAPTAGQAVNQALSGYGQAQGNIGTGQALEQQLINEGNGQGPNPAQTALASNTAANVAQQAALQAGQRGASANAGEIARQAAQTGAATQQAAVGQAATLQAQQQLAAQQGALAAQGQIGNQITNEQAANNQLAGTAIGANNTQNANLISNYGQAQGINAQVAQQNANATNQTLNGLFGGVSSVAALLADGGEVGKDGAMVQKTPPVMLAAGGPVSWAGQYLNSSPSDMGQFATPSTGSVASLQVPQLAQADNKGGSSQGISSGISSIGSMMAKGGKVPAMLSPGEQYLPPKKAEAVAKGKADPMSGKHIPGKAKVPGDNLKNDTVPAELDSGGVVVKRSVMATHDPKKVQQFVQAIMAKSGPKRK